MAGEGVWDVSELPEPDVADIWTPQELHRFGVRLRNFGVQTGPIQFDDLRFVGVLVIKLEMPSPSKVTSSAINIMTSVLWFCGVK